MKKVMVGLSYVQVQLEQVLHHCQLRERDLLDKIETVVTRSCRVLFIILHVCFQVQLGRIASFHQWSDHDLSFPPHSKKHHGPCGPCHHIHENARVLCRQQSHIWLIRSLPIITLQWLVGFLMYYKLHNQIEKRPEKGWWATPNIEKPSV